MRAEIISVGTEILVGSILNTNARFLSQRLAEHAIDVYHQTTVGDNISRIVDCLEEAGRRSDIVICTGGLGPTEDDVTFEAIARFLGKPLTLNRPIYRSITRRLKLRKLKMTKLIAKQCYVPQGARVLNNKEGTAPAIISEAEHHGKKKWFIALPGPPRELEPLFTYSVVPFLRKINRSEKAHFLVRSVRLTGLIEAQVAQKVGDLLKLPPPLTVGIYAKPGSVELKIMAKTSSAAASKRLADRAERTIRKRFGKKVYGVNETTLPSAVGDLLKKKRKTLATAESCTGGLLASRLTEVPGSSNYYLGGLITYHNRIKKEALGVSPALLRKKGAVSREVCAQMAKAARRKFRSDYALAVSGIAGPSGGSAKKPVGLVFIALATPSRTFSRPHRFLGNRAHIQSRAADSALDLLRLSLLG